MTGKGGHGAATAREAPPRTSFAAVVWSIAVLACAEIAIALEYLLAAQIADAILVVLLLNAGCARPETFDPSTAAMRALAAVALIRVIGLGLPLGELSVVVGDGLVAILIGIAAFNLGPAVGVSLRGLLAMPVQGGWWSTALGGLALGFAAYVVGAPALWARGDAVWLIALALAAAAAAAVVEELVFRGLVQVSLHRLSGRVGALAATGLFACTYLGFGSLSLLLVLALAGLLFACAVARSGVLGAALAGHVLLAAGAAVVWPLLFGTDPSNPLPDPLGQLALAAAVVTGAVALWRGPVTPVAVLR